MVTTSIFMRKRTQREIRAIKAKNYKKGGMHSSVVGRNRPTMLTERGNRKNSSIPVHGIASHVSLEIFKKNIQRKPNEHEVSKKISTIKSYNQSEFSKFTNTIKKIPPDKFVGLVATGVSIGTGNPLPIMFYQSYKILKITKNVYDLMNNIKLREELKTLVKMNAEAIGQKVLENKTGEISKKITEQFQQAGIIQNIAAMAQYNEDSVRMLFETTVNNTIDSGIGNFTNWVVDAAL